MKAVRIQWRGPLKVGQFPSTLEEIGALGLNGPGIYLLMMRYPQTTVVYVGKASYLEHRIREHLANYMGFRYALRSENPPPGTEKEAYCLKSPQREGFARYNDLRASMEDAIREVELIEVYYCRCDNGVGSEHYDLSLPLPALTPSGIIKELEASLIHAVKEVAFPENGLTSDKRPITSDNFRRESRKHLFETDTDAFLQWLREKASL
ncbi:MAG: GIY-YIG nuclease family protein [Alphaproteobacteria bacterium]|nr:GIY-YIG nuclease family protein [Alphaproteobacteria bacterium]